ncbi:hypothetical protein D3C72_2343850 [compost metagenome]
MQIGPGGHERSDRVDQVLVAFGGAHHGHAADDDIVVGEAQFFAQGGALDRRRQHDRRIHGCHLLA